MMIWIWCGVMLVSFLVEVFTVGSLISIWFTLGGLFALFCALLNANIIVQLIVFAIVSGLLILLVRPFATKILKGEIQPTNADRIINQHVRLTKSIKEDSWGELHYNGTNWSAVSYDNSEIEEGTLVTVLAIEGAKVIVKKID